MFHESFLRLQTYESRIHNIARGNRKECGEKNEDVSNSLQSDGQPSTADEGRIVANLIFIDFLLIGGDKASSLSVSSNGGSSTDRFSKVTVNGRPWNRFQSFHLTSGADVELLKEVKANAWKVKAGEDTYLHSSVKP